MSIGHQNAILFRGTYLTFPSVYYACRRDMNDRPFEDIFITFIFSSLIDLLSFYTCDSFNAKYKTVHFQSHLKKDDTKKPNKAVEV